MAIPAAHQSQANGAATALTSSYPGIAQREAIAWEGLAIRPGPVGIARHCGKLLHALAIQWQLRQRLKQTAYLLILSHMRSGSSLLTQVLCSHPDILGYGETHTVYRGAGDLLRAAQSVYRMLRKWRVKHKYVADKILHTELLPDIEPLRLLPVKWIVLLRNPADAVDSMVRTLSMDRGAAQAYYQARLRTIEQQACRLADASIPALLTTYERLTEDPRRELRTLSGFLGLEPELQADYEVQRGAQLPGAGDPSDVLKAGRILPRKALRRDCDEQMLAAYESCVGRLEQWCYSSQTDTAAGKSRIHTPCQSFQGDPC